jgi:hypothetical protein
MQDRRARQAVVHPQRHRWALDDPGHGGEIRFRRRHPVVQEDHAFRRQADKVETVLKAEKPWTPTGVAVRGKDVFVLEYTHTDNLKDWAPRVRKLAPDGKVAILASVARDEK